MEKHFSLKELRSTPIAHTDAGDFLFVNGKPQESFLVKGTITKQRASLFYVNIEGEEHTVHRRKGHEIGDEVICSVRASIKDNNITFIITGIESTYLDHSSSLI